MGRAPTFKPGLDGIVWPPVPTGEAATIAALVASLQASERLPLAEIEAGQGAQLARLAAHHARHSPAFRARLAAAGLAPARSTASPGCASWRRCRASSSRPRARISTPPRCRAATSRSARPRRPVRPASR
jgi:hypothetical protein